MDKENQVTQRGDASARKDNETNPNKNQNDPWGNQDIHIVDNVKKCQEVAKQLKL